VYELKRTEGVAREATVLVGVVLPGQQQTGAALEELEGLATAAGARVVGELVQRREAPDKTTYLGSGKVEELHRLVEHTDADAVIFDNDLSPGQTRNLERALSVKVLDRTELILDIFATRAQTYEARLAVELAQLEYSMPRLKRMWTHLSRYTAGIGVRGPGEKQLEVDRRLVEKRVSELRNELRAVQRRKEREVSARRDHMTVCLVGYTNAGKSTLLNALTGSDVLVRDALFATLDTRTRRWQLPGWGPILLSDTVGFVRNLPHHLIASFKATLEEARQANLLLHVADASSPAVEDQIAAAFNVLEEIGIQQKDTLLVLNKIDAMPAPHRLEGLVNRYPSAIPISASCGLGLDRLSAAVADALSRAFLDVDVEMGVENGWALAYLAANGEVLSKRYTDSRVVVHCRIPQRHLKRMDRDGIEIRLHHASGNGQTLPAADPSMEDVA
jgi:GTP-binding protein HflX